MHLFLKRHFWVIPALVVVACAVLAARTVATIMEARMIQSQPAPKHIAHARHAVASARPEKDANGLTTRNMFCSSCDPVAPPADPGVVAEDPGEQVPVTTLPLALVGTIMTARDSDSSATIANTKSMYSGSYGLKDQIPGAGEIVLIKPQVVHFINSQTHRVERIDLIAETAPPKPPPARPPLKAAGPPSPDAQLMAEVDSGVHKIDATHYTLDRALVDKILGDPTVIVRTVRLVPAVTDNKTSGWKMASIRPNSPLSKIGMLSGDTITAVNGFDLGSPDKLLEVYSKVRSAQNLSISVLRSGQPLSMEYAIR